MSEPLIIIARARARQGLEAQMVTAQKALVAATRGAPGCINYELHVSNHEPGLVTFFERWASVQAWQQHMQSEAVRTFRETAGHCIGDFELEEMHQVA
ncbi:MULTISPECIES: putative quinol monooxygenase [Pseudomonas]|uniref:putative quinol monooxygenase n=1 Tax=Pseudomonas TaxID=286 RepID=UPI00069DD9BB|nr:MULTISPECIES: putative quinol monooxygenase [Pseudomonas]MCE0460885.1 antibiotic biosynthesis monooxygenase [Pseudomonas uvaldensis]